MYEVSFVRVVTEIIYQIMYRVVSILFSWNLALLLRLVE